MVFWFYVVLCFIILCFCNMMERKFKWSSDVYYIFFFCLLFDYFWLRLLETFILRPLKSLSGIGL